MAEQRYATPEDAIAASGQWSDAALTCRMDGHSWRSTNAWHNRRYRYFKLVQVCTRCTTERHREVSDRNGHVFASWYQYPEDYQTPGTGRIVGDAKDALRLQAIARTYEVEELGAREQREAEPRAATREAVEGP